MLVSKTLTRVCENWLFIAHHNLFLYAEAINADPHFIAVL